MVSEGASQIIASGGIFNKWWTDGAIDTATFPRFTFIEYIRVWQDAEYGLCKFLDEPDFRYMLNIQYTK